MKKFLRYSIIAISLFAAFAWLNNTSLFTNSQAGTPVLLAHRGLAQTYTREDLERDTCTATRINPPEHTFIENTLPSMEAAFAAGADVVEFDVHPTTDGKFAVFHDWTLDCRTEGKGTTRDHTMADLKKLDVGYGYTADGGQTFPLRGKGVGLMPTLDEVLTAFPDKRFLINVKSNDAGEGEKLAAYLAKLPPEARARLMVYGGTPPTELVHEKLPDVAIGSKKSLQSCLLGYAALGWSGYVPDDVPRRHDAGAAQRRAVAVGVAKQVPAAHGRRRRAGVRARALRRQLRHRGRRRAGTIRQVAEGLCRRHLDQPHRPHRRRYARQRHGALTRGANSCA